MTPKEAIDKIRGMLFGEEVPKEVAPIALAEFPLKDGGVISAEKLEVGMPVTLNGQPAPDGVHALADGSEITVSGGVITAIKEVEIEVAPETPEPAQPVQMAQFAEVSEVETLRSQFAKQDQTIKELFSLVEQLAQASIEQPKETVKSWDDMTALERFRATKHN